MNVSCIVVALLLLASSLFSQTPEKDRAWAETKARLVANNPWLIPAGHALDCDRKAQALEEDRDYVAAERYYRCASAWGKTTNKISEAVVYAAELGRARSLKKLGHPEQTTAICTDWKRRVDLLALRIVTRPLEDYHWLGKELTQSVWEFSCGDQQKAFDLVEAAARTHQHGYLATMPYQRLEFYYRLLGDTERANAAHEKAKLRDHRYRIETGFGGPEDYEAVRNYTKQQQPAK